MLFSLLSRVRNFANRHFQHKLFSKVIHVGKVFSVSSLIAGTIQFTVAYAKTPEVGLTPVTSNTLVSQSEAQLKDLEKKTHFSIDELKRRSATFKEMYPNGMDLEQFAKELKITDHNFAYMLFHAIDTDHNGKIDVAEWLTYASIVSSGNHHEKLDFQFNVYDQNGDGYITFDELVGILNMHLKTGSIPRAVLLHHEHFWQTGYRTPQDLAWQLMKVCDVDHDNRISKAEFEKLSKAIIQLIQFKHPTAKIPEPKFYTTQH